MKYLHLTDTHQEHNTLDIPKEKIDVVFHTGDFNEVDLNLKFDDQKQIDLNLKQTLNFFDWYKNINAIYKIVIGGNHELIDLKILKEEAKKRNIIFLHNETFVYEDKLEKFNIFAHGGYMNIDMGQFGYFLDNHPWNNIPKDTNILLTHTPCENIGDTKIFNGCPKLKEKIKELYNLRLHLFGHVHEGAGEFKYNNVLFINGCNNQIKVREIFNF